MKAVGTALKLHLTAEVTTMALCWRIALLNGSVYRYTDHDKAITCTVSPYAGESFLPVDSFLGSAINSTRDGTVSDMEVLVAFSDDAISESDLLAGLLNGATVDVFSVNWHNVTQGYVVHARGWTVGRFEPSGETFKGELRSKLALLQQDILEVYSPTCRATLGDYRCKISMPYYTVTGRSVESADPSYPRQRFTASVLTGPDDRYRYGRVIWYAGLNAGLSMECIKWVLSTKEVTLFQPMPYEIKAGDTFSIEWGCDKKPPTCANVFGNIVNFRGEPTMQRTSEAKVSRQAHSAAWDHKVGPGPRTGKR